MASWLDYLTGGLQTALGLGSQAIAPGNPIGLSMMGNGVGQIANNAAGGLPGGFATPGTAGTPSIPQMTPMLPPYINPSQIGGVSTAQAGQPNWLSMLGQTAPNIMNMFAQGAAAVQPSTPMQRPAQAPAPPSGSAGPVPQIQQIISQPPRPGPAPQMMPPITPNSNPMLPSGSPMAGNPLQSSNLPQALKFLQALGISAPMAGGGAPMGGMSAISGMGGIAGI